MRFSWLGTYSPSMRFTSRKPVPFVSLRIPNDISRFEKFLEGSYGYAENIEFLLAVRAKAVAEENQVVLAWYAHGMYKILSSFRSYTTYARPKNVPTIVKLIQVIGIQLFKDL